MLPRISIMHPKKQSYLEGIISGNMLGSKLGLAEVEMDASLTPQSLGFEKWVSRSLIIRVNDKRILLDGNNQAPYTSMLIESGEITKFDLVIKLQCRDPNLWNCPIPITYWTFPELNTGLAESFRKTYKTTSKQYRCGFVGRTYSFRDPFLQMLEDLDQTDVEYWHRRQHKAKRMGFDDYFKRMCTWKSALVLRGTRDGARLDGKTWREVECASLGLPIMLDVGLGGGTHYYIPFEPEKHYYPIEDPEDIEEALCHIDPEMSNRAMEWYESIASQEGICRTFFSLLKDFDII